MKYFNSSKDKILHKLGTHPVLATIAAIAEKTETSIFAVGGFVRDTLLQQDGKDIDFVIEGDGLTFAKHVAHSLKTRRLTIYKKFGTAMIEWQGFQLEFVGARKESYRGDSRNPDVAPAELSEDLARRDFTINAMALSLNKNTFLDLVDPHNGQLDLQQKIIRTPLEPLQTFSDDPLRILRGVRFATRLGFTLEQSSLTAMQQMGHRLKIISQERITDELLKILSAPKPGAGFLLLDKAGILRYIFPELVQLKGIETRNGYAHKDVFLHTLEVLDNVAAVSKHIPLRLSALLHDIAKPVTKAFKPGKGWSFHGHEEIGARMLPAIFRRMRLSNEWLKYVQKLTRLHLRPIALTEEECTDSSYRRLLFQAGDDLEDLVALCRADITSKNMKRKQEYLKNFDFVVKRLNEVEETDKLRAFQSPVRGEEIMRIMQIGEGPEVGRLKKRIESAILDGEIPNDYEAAKTFLLSLNEQQSTNGSAATC